MERPYIEKLQEFGLSEKEAKVYMASLELGSATADQLSKQADVNRSTTYVQIEQLMAMGLMSTHEEGKKTMFTVESPSHLSRLFKKKIEALELQSQALESFVPDLTRLYDSAGERPLVRYFQGKEGLTTMRNEVLKLKNTTVYFAFSFDYLWNIYDWNELIEFTKVRSERKIRSHTIYNKSGKDIDSYEKYLLEARRLSIAEFPFEADIYIFGNKVAIASTKGTIAGVIIESQTIANSMLSLFKLAWQAAELNANSKKIDEDRKKPGKDDNFD